MSMELMDEHEQGERVRAWLRENGASIITGVALGVAGIIGWQWWGSNQAEHRVEAAAQYASLLAAADRQDRDGAEAIVKGLTAAFDDTAYATLGSLVWADLQLKAGETLGAADTLRQAMSAATDPALKGLVRTRLARSLIAAGQPDQALALLDEGKSTTESALEAELRGDALSALARKEDAVAAYRDAFKRYDATLPSRRLVEMKLLNLGAKADDVEA